MEWAIIRVRFVNSSDAVGRVIDWSEGGSLFDHVEFGAPEGTWIGARAEGGVQERPANYNPDLSREYVYELPVEPAKAALLLKWAREQIGTPYNFADIAGIFTHIRDLDSTGRRICSQFCFLGLDMIFPGDVLNALPEFAQLVTPETLHLSPIFVGHLVSKKG